MERVPSALILEFQSTLSMRRATAAKLYKDETIFQSTLSMRRATCLLYTRAVFAMVFQSTLSMRRATGSHGHHHAPFNFNPRSP